MGRYSLKRFVGVVNYSSWVGNIIKYYVICFYDSVFINVYVLFNDSVCFDKGFMFYGYIFSKGCRWCNMGKVVNLVFMFNYCGGINNYFFFNYC